VTHFVYRARLPFHPMRLHDFILKFFVLQEPDWTRMLGGPDAESDDDADVSSGSDDESEADNVPAAAAAGAEGGGEASKAPPLQQQQQQQQLQSVAAGRRQALESQFGLLLRSKGFVWLATRPGHIGEWSQAGSLLSFSTGGGGGGSHISVVGCWQVYALNFRTGDARRVMGGGGGGGGTGGGGGWLTVACAWGHGGATHGQCVVGVDQFVLLSLCTLFFQRCVL
jgi:G3E family GTPase